MNWKRESFLFQKNKVTTAENLLHKFFLHLKHLLFDI